MANVNLPPFTAEESAHLPYVSDLDLSVLNGWDACVIKSPIGTGKTELIKRIIDKAHRRLKREPTVCYITYRVALVETAAARIDALPHTALIGEDRILLKNAPQVAICYDSLWRVEGNRYDLVFIDEVSQFLQHTDSDTQRGGKAARNYGALKQLVRDCETFVALDAHADDIAVKWVRQLRGQRTFTLANTYRPRRGTLTLHASLSALYLRALQLVQENQGCVVIPTSSKAESECAFKLLSDLCGAENGMLVNADNSGSRAVQAFLRDINNRLPNLRFLVYSPSLQTGLDITAPVRAVLGIFHNRPLAARDMLQMMGRCRNAQERRAYVQGGAGNGETDAAALRTKHELNAAETARLAHFDTHEVSAADDDLRGMNRLISLYEAQRNRELNDPLGYFVAYAEADGHTLAHDDSANEAIGQLLKATRDALADARKNAILNAEPVTHDEFEQFQRAGTLTPDILHGHERFMIEDTVGLIISPTLYDDLRTRHKRERVRLLAALLDEVEHLQTSDRDEAANRHRLNKRKHLTAKRQLFEDIMKHVFNCDLLDLPDVLQDIPAADIEARLTGFLECFQDRLVALLNWRPTHHSDSALPVLRWVLKQVGLKLDRRQVMENRRRFMVYSLNADQWGAMLSYARARLAHQERKRAENADYYIPANIVSYPVCSNTENAHKPASKHHVRHDGAATTDARIAQLQAVMG